MVLSPLLLLPVADCRRHRVVPSRLPASLLTDHQCRPLLPSAPPLQVLLLLQLLICVHGVLLHGRSELCLDFLALAFKVVVRPCSPNLDATLLAQIFFALIFTLCSPTKTCFVQEAMYFSNFSSSSNRLTLGGIYRCRHEITTEKKRYAARRF